MRTRRAESTTFGAQPAVGLSDDDRPAVLTAEGGDETVSRNLLLKFLALTRRTV